MIPAISAPSERVLAVLLWLQQEQTTNFPQYIIFVRMNIHII